MTADPKIAIDDWDFALQQTRAVDAAPDLGLRNLLRVVPPAPALEALPTPTRHSPSQDWAKLIEQVQGAAKHAREVEAQAQERERRVQALVERVREDVRMSEERIRVAEDQMRDIQARADARILAAEERARAAEERARIAEQWLARVHETIVTEFINPAAS